MKQTSTRVTARKDKNTDHSKKEQVVPKSRFDEYVDLFTLKEVVVTEEWVEKFSQQMLSDVIKDENIVKLSQYFRLRGINSSTIARWSDKYPKFALAYKEALLAVGDRREINGLWKEMDGGMVSYTMAHYDPSWVKLAEWRAALRKESEGQSGNNITVVMEGYPSSDLVPPKKI